MPQQGDVHPSPPLLHLLDGKQPRPRHHRPPIQSPSPHPTSPPRCPFSLAANTTTESVVSASGTFLREDREKTLIICGGQQERAMAAAAAAAAAAMGSGGNDRGTGAWRTLPPRRPSSSSPLKLTYSTALAVKNGRRQRPLSASTTAAQQRVASLSRIPPSPAGGSGG